MHIKTNQHRLNEWWTRLNADYALFLLFNLHLRREINKIKQVRDWEWLLNWKAFLSTVFCCGCWWNSLHRSGFRDDAHFQNNVTVKGSFPAERRKELQT